MEEIHKRELSYDRFEINVGTKEFSNKKELSQPRLR
jgi:hypothetical protein